MVDASDVDACAQEAIHIPGAVQPFGVLCAMRPGDPTVIAASRNVAALGAAQILGRGIDALFVAADVPVLAETMARARPGEHHWLRLRPRRGPAAGRALDACAHRHAGMVLLEVELPPPPDADFDARLQAVLSAEIGRLYAAVDEATLWRTATDAMRTLSGFDRVMLYRFDIDDHGVVVAESLAEGVDGYLGQHFPASDIPPQARQIFRDNWTRMIPDRAALPSPLVAAAGERGRPIDLSLAGLRAVSPLHLEYLANMQVAASLTVSVKHEERLWGLLACHHLQPRFVPQAVRRACEMLGRLVSTMVAARAAEAGWRGAERLRSINGALRAQMVAAGDFAIGLTQGQWHLLHLVGAGGAAVFSGQGRWHLIGQVPTPSQLQGIMQWLAHAHPHVEVFATDALVEVYAEAAAFKDVGAGLMAMTVPRSERGYVLWFKPEVIRTVTWAGDPRKRAQRAPGAAGGVPSLHPRASFGRWREVVRDRALAWRDDERQAALALREAVIEVDLSRQVRRERAARAESDAQRHRFAFLAAASAALAASLAPEQALAAFAELAAARFCDWVAIYLPEGPRQPRMAAARGDPPAAADAAASAATPGAGPLVRRLLRHRTPQGQAVLDRLAAFPALGMVRDLAAAAPRPARAVRVTPGWLDRAAPSPQYARFVRQRLGLDSLLLVPIVTRGQVLGAIKFARTGRRQAFAPAEIELAEELGRRVAQSLDNGLLYASAQAALAARAHVLGVVSHDLRNPIGAVALEAQALDRRLARAGEVPGAEAMHAGLRRIGGAARRMRRLVDDMLNLTQLEAGTLAVEAAPVTVGRLVGEAREMLAPLAEDRGLSLEARVAAPEAEVDCDLERVLQIFSNLVGNAIKFTPRAGHIQIEALQAGREVNFCVRDDGPGIGPAALPHIFDRYWQDRAARRDGVGLGLAIAKGLVEAHGGQIWVESAPGDGSAFFFSLPRAPRAGGAAPAGEGAPRRRPQNV